jgi:hypothetical protein
MPNMTHDIRLQPRWTVFALTGGADLPSAAAACGGWSSAGASEPGRARFGSDDT